MFTCVISLQVLMKKTVTEEAQSELDVAVSGDDALRIVDVPPLGPGMYVTLSYQKFLHMLGLRK